MTHPADTRRPCSTADFTYDLPPDLIAERPAPERGADRLLVVRRTAAGPVMDDRMFHEFVSLPAPGDLLVLNSTRVRHARLLGRRASGRPAELLLIHPAGEGSWIAIGKPGRALQPGKTIVLGDGEAAITVDEVLPGGERRVRFTGITAEEAMRRWGRLPLPPYIVHAPGPDDEERYQTVYAEAEGSVAAPTAGLHFTEAMLDGLRARGVTIATLDLEVGPGTFRPVEEEDPRRHPMHVERFTIPATLPSLIRATRASGRAVWATGTTVVRALEAAADPEGIPRAGAGATDLLILPGYRFRCVDRLLTNFHLPRTTLLMLVAAVLGVDATRAAYAHAVAARYRFYSYGDAMVIV